MWSHVSAASSQSTLQSQTLQQPSPLLSVSPQPTSQDRAQSQSPAPSQTAPQPSPLSNASSITQAHGEADQSQAPPQGEDSLRAGNLKR